MSVAQTLTVARMSLKGGLRGFRLLGLGALAAVPSAVVAALAASGAGPSTLANSTESLFLSLTLPVVILLLTLVLFVAQFRTEIEDDTLAYLLARSIPRTEIAVGKYFGALGAALAFSLPATFIPLAVAGAGGAPAPSAAVILSLGMMAFLATMTFGAAYCFLGLITRSALLIGLLVGFLWEELVPLLPGYAPRLTLVYYLRNLASLLVSTGPLSGFSTPYSLPAVIAVPVAVAIVFLGLTAGVFRSREIPPGRTTA